MPPLILRLIVPLLGAVATGFFYLWKKDPEVIEDLWNEVNHKPRRFLKLLSAWKKKEPIVVIGPSGVGKSLLKNYIAKKKFLIPEKETATEKSESIENPDFSDKKFVMITDLPGSTLRNASNSLWKTALKGGGTILYLCRADLLESKDSKHLKIISRDADTLDRWGDNKDKELHLQDKAILIVVTHFDKVSHSSKDEIKSHDSLKKLQMALGGTEKVHVLVESLMSGERISRASQDILDHINGLQKK